jgi:hypothetical protein
VHDADGHPDRPAERTVSERTRQGTMQIQYVDAAPGEYRPGACNIGPEEIARRRRGGLLMLTIAAIVAGGLIVIDAPAIARLLVALPLTASINAFEQARRRFCVGFALAGIHDVGLSRRQEEVGSSADRAADRRAALVMVAYSGAIAVLIAVGFVLLPV